MVKKLKKQVKPFIATNIALSTGSIAVQKIGGPTAAASGAGLGTLASFQPTIGLGLGATAVARSLSSLEPKKKRRRR